MKIEIPKDFETMALCRTVAELCKLYDVSKHTVYNWKKQLNLPSFRHPPTPETREYKGDSPEQIAICLNYPFPSCRGLCPEIVRRRRRYVRHEPERANQLS